MSHPTLMALQLVVAERLCQAAIDPARLPQVLESLLDMTGASAGSLATGRLGGAWHRIKREGSSAAPGQEILRQRLLDAALRLPPNRLHRLPELLVADGGVANGSSSLRDACALNLILEGGRLGQIFLVLGADAARDKFDPEALRALESVGPLISQVWEAQCRNDAMCALGTSIMSRCDRYHVGLVVVDIDGFVFFHNQAARRIFDAASGLLLRDNRLVLPLPAEMAALERGIRDVLASDLPSGCFMPKFFSASREGELPLALALNPFRPRSDETGYVTVMAYDPGRPAVERREVIQWIYLLSDKEADLVCSLTAGESLEFYAERCNRSQDSVRSLLKRVFRKTGTSRQTELVKLVLAGPVAMVL
jgi:DNA-binding CsgD family transcriptional regulator